MSIPFLHEIFKLLLLSKLKMPSSPNLKVKSLLNFNFFQDRHRNGGYIETFVILVNSGVPILVFPYTFVHHSIKESIKAFDVTVEIVLSIRMIRRNALRKIDYCQLSLIVDQKVELVEITMDEASGSESFYEF